MSAFRLLVVAGLLLAAAPAAADRVAIVNLAPPEASLGRSIARLRADLAAVGLAAPSDGPLRRALEQPVASAPDGGPLARARALYRQARDAYAEFDYPGGLARLDEVDALARGLPASPPVLALLADRHLLAGLIHVGAERPAAAREAFRAAHALAPERDALDPATYPPQVVDAYAAAIAARVASGSIALASLPRGASVRIDGRPLRRAREVAEGVHWVSAGAAGYAPAGASVRVVAGEVARVELSLRPIEPAARARELRAELIGRRSDDDTLRAAAAELAALAEVEHVVLVRRAGDRGEAARYDAAAGTLGPFGRLDAARLAPAPDAVALGDDEDDRAATPWYRSGWGRGLLIGGGIVLAGAAIYAATTWSGGDEGVTIGGWCFEGEPCAR